MSAAGCNPAKAACGAAGGADVQPTALFAVPGGDGGCEKFSVGETVSLAG